jgi:HSP20 family molecular chaperone IbpA
MATSKPAPYGKVPSVGPRIVPEHKGESIHQRIRDRIAERAYFLYESSGREEGHDLKHWLHAESQILQHGLDIRESGSWLSVNASLPDVSGGDVEIYLEPTRVIVRAEKTSAPSNTSSQTEGLTQQELFLVEDLNTEIEPNTASASFRDQKLSLMVKKRYPANATAPHLGQAAG